MKQGQAPVPRMSNGGVRSAYGLTEHTLLRVQQVIARLTAGKTALMVAHRMRTVLHADHIVVLDEGRVVEDDTPSGLLERGGLFARLCRLQGAACTTDREEVLI